MADASAAIEAHEIEPVLDETYPLRDVAEAYRTVRSGGRVDEPALTFDRPEASRA